MKYLIPFFLISSSFAKGPGCEELGSILTQLETKLYATKLTGEECRGLEASKLKAPKNPNFPTSEQSKLIEENRCKDLASIELQLRNLESKLTLISGIKSLKEQIKKDIDKIQKNPPKPAKAAAKDLVQNVTVASTLEILLSSKSQNGDPFIKTIAEMDKTLWQTPADFEKYLKKFCKSGNTKDIDVCDDEFIINEETFKEIEAFVALGKGSFTEKEVKKLQETLKILKGGKPYSYTALAGELKKSINAEGDLSKEAIASIKNFPKIENPKDYSFLKKINESKDGVASNVAAPQFKFLLSDLKARHEWQMKSKLSVILQQHGSKLKDTNEADYCYDQALELTSPIAPCLESLKGKLVRGQQSAIDDVMKDFEFAEAHLKELKAFEAECVPNEKLEYPEKCFDAVLASEANFVKEAEALHLLKDEMMKPQQDLLKLRNFAIEKFQSQKCQHVSSSPVSECFEATDYTLNPEALVLSGDVLKIIIVQDQKTPDSDVSELCEDEEIKLPNKDRVCALVDDQTPDHISKVKQDSFRQTTLPDDGHDPFRSSVYEGLGRLFNEGMRTLMAPTMPFSPPLSYTPSYLPSYTEHANMRSMSLGFGLHVPSPQASLFGRSSHFFANTR